MSQPEEGYLIALEEARLGAQEGGLPVGSAIVSANGRVIGRGRNQRVQKRSAILHAETAAFDDAGRSLPLKDLEGSTLYTTLSPCPMCAGAAVFFKVARVVIADNMNMTGQEQMLRDHGIEVVVKDDEETKERMKNYIAKAPNTWLEGTSAPPST